MQSMVSGFRKAVGVGRKGPEKKKGSLAGNLLWLVVIAAALGMLLYRYTQ